MRRLTVVSHFFNEEYLLPWWLRHHREIFDHGILLDYGSTDASVEICRELVPTWEVRPSRNAQFSASAVDLEVMDVERELSGWKIALNTTEFLCCSDVGQLLENLSHRTVSGAYIQGVVMADRPETKDVPLSPSLPLVAQRTDGYFESEFPTGAGGSIARSRLLHRRADGAYNVGRHTSFRHRIVRHPPEALVLWYAFSPWTPETVARKVQIQQRIPGKDKSGQDGAAVFGAQHLLDEAQLNATWKVAADKARDLSQDPNFRAIVAPASAVQSTHAATPADGRIEPYLAKLDAIRKRRLHPPLRRASAVQNIAQAYEFAAQRAWAKSRRLAALALLGDSTVRLRALVTLVSPRLALTLRSAKDRRAT
jgi:hypothetical protein